MMASTKHEIFIVDDSKLMVSMARKILEKDPRLAVASASSGEECLEILKTYKPDLILLDIVMPGKDGFEVLHELKSNPETNAIPVIFLTGDEHGESEIRGLKEGAVDFITKPFVPEVLLQRVKNNIELSLLQKNLQREVARQTEKNRLLTREVIEALSSTVDAKDHYTRGHSARVGKYAREIARRLGKNEAEQEEIYYMGLLHDIGKIGVSGNIIRKDGRLEDDEFEEIKEHPITGFNILRKITVLPDLATGARWHHEHYDGTGYPDGLKGTNIPEGARIIAVADAYDAMTSKRSYSQIRPQAEVRAEIEKGKGRQFDPVIADIMIEMIDEDKDYKMKESEEEADKA